MPNNNRTQPILQIIIDCMPDASISVTGFPLNLLHALDILATAQKAVLSHFQTQAQKGNIDDNLSILPPPIIASPKNKLVDPTGKPIVQ
jgi:hypothetical protein